MNQKRYDYTIKSVVSKREDGYVNKYHAQVTGAKCALGMMEVGWRGALLIDIFNTEEVDWNHWFYTSPVESMITNEAGELVIETMNSIYTLVPIKDGGSK